MPSQVNRNHPIEIEHTTLLVGVGDLIYHPNYLPSSSDLDKVQMNQCVMRINGAAGGTRTPDPRITNAMLYHLSYCGAGTKYTGFLGFWMATRKREMVNRSLKRSIGPAKPLRAGRGGLSFASGGITSYNSWIVN